jgi:hypothetical protein
MKIIAYRRSAGSELALLRHLSQLRRTESLKRFQDRMQALKANAQARAQSQARLLGKGLTAKIETS